MYSILHLHKLNSLQKNITKATTIYKYSHADGKRHDYFVVTVYNNAYSFLKCKPNFNSYAYIMEPIYQVNTRDI